MGGVNVNNLDDFFPSESKTPPKWYKKSRGNWGVSLVVKKILTGGRVPWRVSINEVKTMRDPESFPSITKLIIWAIWRRRHRYKSTTTENWIAEHNPNEWRMRLEETPKGWYADESILFWKVCLAYQNKNLRPETCIRLIKLIDEMADMRISKKANSDTPKVLQACIDYIRITLLQEESILSSKSETNVSSKESEILQEAIAWRILWVLHDKNFDNLEILHQSIVLAEWDISEIEESIASYKNALDKFLAAWFNDQREVNAHRAPRHLFGILSDKILINIWHKTRIDDTRLPNSLLITEDKNKTLIVVLVNIWKDTRLNQNGDFNPSLITPERDKALTLALMDIWKATRIQGKNSPNINLITGDTDRILVSAVNYCRLKILAKSS